jgi:L-threonylcarbamoyladenylate synthase
MTIINGFEESALQQAATMLRSGEVVVFPTETVYGLGADAYNSYAVAKIFEVKSRPVFDPLIVHIGEKQWILDIVQTMPPEAEKLMERFWPGPLTIILEKKKVIPDIVTAGLGTVAVRMPSHPVALELIRKLGRPVAAPSANPFGYMSPTRAEHVARMFKGKVRLILDGGDSVFGIESTIVSVRDGKVYLHRHGSVPVEDLSRVVGTVFERKTSGTVEAPGELPYHYAPHRPLRIVKSLDDIRSSRTSLLAFREPDKAVISKYVKVLSKNGDLKEAAANFFSFLIELDREDVDMICAEAMPERGIGRAMMERLRKASRKYDYITR